MVSDWPQQRLGDIVTNFDARRVPLSARERECRKGKYPYYGATGIMDYIDDYLFEGLHLLVAEDGSVETESGTPFLQLVDGCFWVNNHAHVLKGETDTDTRYLFYALSSIRIRPFMTGSVQAKLSQTNLNNVPIPYPSVHERTAIAHILGTLDDKIELNCRMNQTLEAMAQTLFKSWFVDFEPFRDQGMEESPLGLIPKAWSCISLGSFTQLDKGVSYKGKFLSDNGLPMINLGCFLGRGGFSLQNLKYYDGDYGERHLVYPGDIVIANTDITQKREVLGSPAIVPPSETYSNYLFTHHVYAIRFGNNYQHWKKYVFFALLQAAFRERAIGFATGTTVLALPRDAILDYQAVNPGDRIIDAFTDKLEPMLALKYANDEQSYTLATLRDVLLPKLLSGEIKIQDAEKFVEKAV